MAAAERQSEFECTKGGINYEEFEKTDRVVMATHYIQHYRDVIVSAMASQITSISTVYSVVCSGTNQRKHQSSVSMAFGRGGPPVTGGVPSKGPVTGIMFPFFYDVIMFICKSYWRVSVLNPPGNLSPMHLFLQLTPESAGAIVNYFP